MFTTTHILASVTAVTLASILTACGTTESATGLTRGQQAEQDRLTKQAQTYVGDPWEKRFRDQFWARQHVHDSWNRCHLGEHAPRPRGCDGTSLTPRG